MHGLIFTSFQNFVRAKYGSAQAERILEGEPVYLISETYDDERLLGLVTRTAEVVGAAPDAIVHDFGVFTGETIFPRIYPAYYAIASDTRSFFLGIESHIHQLVRATIPNAEPPQLRVSELGDDGVSIVYTSAAALRPPARPRGGHGAPLSGAGRDRGADLHAPRRRRLSVRDPAAAGLGGISPLRGRRRIPNRRPSA